MWVGSKSVGFSNRWGRIESSCLVLPNGHKVLYVFWSLYLSHRMPNLDGGFFHRTRSWLCTT